MYNFIMKNKIRPFLKRVKGLPVKKIVIYSIVTLVVVTILFSVFGKKTPSVRDLYVVKKMDAQKTVLSSGKVVSDTDLALSFQSSDVVRSINVKVGDKVPAGKILATLSNSSQLADITRAKGTLLGAQARYRKALEGNSNADINAAQDALNNTIRTQNRLVENARQKLYSDGLIAETTRSDMSLSLAPTITGTYSGDVETKYNLSLYQSTQTIKYTGAESGTLTILTLPQSLGKNGLTITFPSTSAYSFNDEWIINIPNKTSPNYTTNLNAYNAAIANRDESIAAAKSKLDVLKTQTRKVDIDAAYADVLVAKAGVASAEAALEKTIIRSPAAGTITKIDIKLGDLVEANKPVITLQDVTNLYVESNVNEADIMGVKMGQSVEITFEALGKENKFNGEISLVNLGATTNNSIVNYKIKALLKDTNAIRSGMTADLRIITSSVKDAIVVPTRYIGEEKGTSYVYVVTDEKKKLTRKQNITKGEVLDGGTVVVTSGLNVDDQIGILDETK